MAELDPTTRTRLEALCDLDVRDVLRAFDAAEAARDQAQAAAADAMMAHGLAVESLRHVEAECKRDMAACEGHRGSLEALEAAAREIAVLWPSDPKLWAWEEVEALVAAVEALATPPGAGA